MSDSSLQKTTLPVKRISTSSLEALDVLIQMHLFDPANLLGRRMLDRTWLTSNESLLIDGTNIIAHFMEPEGNRDSYDLQDGNKTWQGLIRLKLNAKDAASSFPEAATRLVTRVQDKAVVGIILARRPQNIVHVIPASNPEVEYYERSFLEENPEHRKHAHRPRFRYQKPEKDIKREQQLSSPFLALVK